MIAQSLTPGQIAVATNDAIRRSHFESLLRIEGWVNTSEHDKCSTLTGETADVVPAKGITGVNADADDVAGADSIEVQLLYRLVT